MTLTVYPEGVQKSGSGGGTTHGRCRYGAYTRSRSRPVNPNSIAQNAARIAVAALAQDWQNVLTQAQRDAWDVYASNVPWVNKLNQTVHLTGFSHYTRSNAPRIQQGFTQINAAPVIFNLAAPEQLLSFTFIVGPPNFLVAFDDTVADWVTEDNAHQLIYRSKPTNVSRKFYGGPWIFAGAIDGSVGAPPVSPASLTLPATWAVGQRVRIRTRISRADGRLSEFSYAETIAT